MLGRKKERGDVGDGEKDKEGRRKEKRAWEER